MTNRLLHGEAPHMRRVTAAIGAGLAMVLAACAATSEPAAPLGSPANLAPDRPMNPTLEAVTEAVLADAAKRTGLKASGLVIERAEPVTWADGSLGCAEPGMKYTMAPVPGYRIRVRAGEQVLDYHANRRGYFVLCPTGRSTDPVGEAASS
jgi:hypothetical protein